MLTAALFLAAVFTRPMERVSSMDPAMSQAVYDSHALQLVFEPLLNIDYEARPYRLTPGYCELPEVSEDSLVYAFRVCEGEGRNAADVVRSLERLRDPEIVTPNGWLVADVDTIVAKDEKTVEIRLKRRSHVFPWLMAMTPASVVAKDGSGTGPFRLAKWRKNHEMVFVRKDMGEKVKMRGEGEQWRKDSCSTNCQLPATNCQLPATNYQLPATNFSSIDTVRYLVIDDVSTQWLMFLKGEVDMLGEVSRDNWDSLLDEVAKVRKDPNEKCTYLPGVDAYLHSAPTLTSGYLGMNMKDETLGGNRKLRQALNAAFDFPEYEKFYQFRVIQSTTPVPPGVAGRLETPFAYAFDLEKAKKLIAEAGYPEGIDPKTGRRLVLTLAIGRASQSSREQAELLASFYEKIGVRLEAKFYTWDAFMKAVNEGRVQLYSMGWVGDYPDAENFLQLFHSKNASPGPNHSCYSNPEYDREFDAAMSAATAAEREDRWRRCQEILREDCPWVFVSHTKANSLLKPCISGYSLSDFPYGEERLFRKDVRK